MPTPIDEETIVLEAASVTIAGGLEDVAHSLDGIAEGLQAVAAALNRLGTAGAVTSAGTVMGAIELLALEIKNAGHAVAEAIESAQK